MENNKLRIFEINGEEYISLDQFTKRNIFNFSFKGTDYKITIEKHKSKSIDYYWERAAKEGMREKFMNTIRPLLKEKLGYSYSELACEEKSKLLCKRYYESSEKGEIYKGPYLIE